MTKIKLMNNMKKTFKPGERITAFQEKKKKHMKRKKTYSEADMGSMAGYDPNLGLGKAGMRKLGKSAPKPMVIKSMAKSSTKFPTRKFGLNSGGKAGGRIQNPYRGSNNENTTTKEMFKKKHAKKHKKSMSSKHCKSCKC